MIPMSIMFRRPAIDSKPDKDGKIIGKSSESTKKDIVQKNTDPGDFGTEYHVNKGAS